MKLAPLSATLALLLLVLGVAISKPTTPVNKVLPLDFSGVDTVRIIDVGDAASIQISDEVPPRASFKDLKKNQVTAARAGSVMTVTSNMQGYDKLELVVPSSVRTFVVGSANVRSDGATLEELSIHAAGSVGWTGNIRHLRIAAVPPKRKCKPDCGFEVNVTDGEIARVEVRAPGGKVHFFNPDHVDVGDLHLAPGGKLTLHNATRLGNIVLHDSAPAQVAD